VTDNLRLVLCFALIMLPYALAIAVVCLLLRLVFTRPLVAIALVAVLWFLSRQ